MVTQIIQIFLSISVKPDSLLLVSERIKPDQKLEGSQLRTHPLAVLSIVM